MEKLHKKQLIDLVKKIVNVDSELVKSQDHFDGLAEQNEKDVDLFMKRKKATDEII